LAATAGFLATSASFLAATAGLLAAARLLTTRILLAAATHRVQQTRLGDPGYQHNTGHQQCGEKMLALHGKIPLDPKHQNSGTRQSPTKWR
jgi:hypothetical protein